MGKKKEKGTESKKHKDKADKTKGGSFLDNLRPSTSKPENTRGTGNKVNDQADVAAKTRIVVAGGIVAVAIGALALVGLNMSGRSGDSQVNAPAAVTQQSARATSEAAAANLLPKPLAPQKTSLAETSKSANKSGKLTSKAKNKKSVAASKKQKAVKQTKKSKKTLAAKSMD